MILSNANFSEDDKVLLECILDDLTRKKIPATMENIKNILFSRKLIIKQYLIKMQLLYALFLSLFVKRKTTKINSLLKLEAPD